MKDKSDNYAYIDALVKERAYALLGQLGVLLEALDTIRIPHDTMTISESEINGGKLKSVCLIIPPNEDEEQVVVFSFRPDFSYDHTYIENAWPLAYYTTDNNDDDDDNLLEDFDDGEDD